MNDQSRPLRFYDNRQKYLSVATTSNEKSKIAERATLELDKIIPRPPALRIFDAGVGDATLLSHVLRSAHRHFPHVPVYVIGKEISLEDIRLSLEKLPDQFVEHGPTVAVLPICLTRKRRGSVAAGWSIRRHRSTGLMCR